MITLLLALAVAASQPAGEKELGPLARLTLRDQYGHEDSLEAHRGQVVLVTVVHAKRLRKLRGWETALRDRFRNLHYLRIADVPPDPPVTHEEVARKLRERVPNEVSILIDVERRWAKSLELDTREPNLLVFDRSGRLVSTYRGSRTPTLDARVSRDLEKLLEADGP